MLLWVVFTVLWLVILGGMLYAGKIMWDIWKLVTARERATQRLLIACANEAEQITQQLEQQEITVPQYLVN